MTKKVVIYTRVSTLDQTIDNQLIELRDHCSKMGWEVVKKYADEGLSGTLSRDKRPALNFLIGPPPLNWSTSYDKETEDQRWQSSVTSRKKSSPSYAR